MKNKIKSFLGLSSSQGNKRERHVAKRIEDISLTGDRAPIILSENEINTLVANKDSVAIFEALASVDPKTSILTSICFNLDCNQCHTGLLIHDNDDDLMWAVDNKDVVIPVTCCICELSTNIGLDNIEFELSDSKNRKVPDSDDMTYDGAEEARLWMALHDDPLDANELIDILEDGLTDSLKIKAAETLSKCDPDDVVEDLADLIMESDLEEDVEDTVVETLEKLGSEGKEALKELEEDGYL